MKYERILELYRQAWVPHTDIDPSNNMPYETTIFSVDKFAELIVRECFNVVNDFALEQSTSDPEDKLGESLYVSMKITDAAWKIKEHFGVEE